VKTFEVYVHDDRYSVLTLHIISVRDEARVKEIAERLMAESEHHLGVEVSEDGRRLFGLGSFGVRPELVGPAAKAC
jgi:hypothetical protein